MLDKELQQQTSGDNSLQVQAGIININYNGITEERARQIFQEKLHDVIKAYSLESHEIAQKRLQLYSADLIPKLVHENLLECLRDPAVQILLQETEKTAVQTERPGDYTLLSELLIHRVKKGKDRNIIAGVNQAVKIVDEISDEALLGLTVANAVEVFIPTAGLINKGLQALSDLYDNILYEELPHGLQWQDHLDILNAIRIEHIGELRKFEDYFPSHLLGYIDVGINKTSDDYKQALDLLIRADIPVTALVEHELCEGYVRLPVVNRYDMETLLAKNDFNTNASNSGEETKIKIEEQKAALNKIYNLYEKNESLKRKNIESFMKMFNEYDSLKCVRDWWNSIHNAFYITAVGKVLAYANTQKHFPDLPELKM